VSLSRRQLLVGTAAGVAGTAIGEAVAARASSLPRPDASGIDHIVVVVMENRSFDHYLGWVPKADGRQAGLVYRDERGRPHRTHHLQTTHGCGFRGPQHSYDDGHAQLNGGRCDGFRRGGNDDFAIGYYSGADLPFYGPLVTKSTVCDRWFSAVLAPTQPNRNYTHSGRTDRLENKSHHATMPTLWDRLTHAGVPATYYFNDVPYLRLWGDRYASIAKRFDEFLVDAAGGTLPAFSYVDPSFDSRSVTGANDDHPHCDIRRGQAFVSTIAQALVSSPLWPRTALVITYDEWGGFFDHVTPPRHPDEGPIDGMDRHQAGFRVPAFVLSPYARRGAVSHHVFDHASIVKFATWRFGLRSLAPRDRHAVNIAHALDFRRPDFSVPNLPVVADPGPHTCGGPSGLLDVDDDPWWEPIKDIAPNAWRHV
jgi:phospholipase C